MSYLAIVFIVGLLIVIHEIGHLVAAKLCGIPVSRFSLGFGRKVAECTHAETSYRLSWIPIGGYVLPGIDQDEIHALPAHKQIAFALGGPAANLIAALVGIFLLGLVQFDLTLSAAASFAVTGLWTGLQQQVLGLSALFSNVDQISGIVGIVAVGGTQFASTVTSLLTFSVVINLSLAVMNLLPLPPLDGGRIVFCVLEKLYRPIARVETPVTLAGWAMVLMLMVYVTIQDVGKILA
jgi:regulator of sigma E protease